MQNSRAGLIARLALAILVIAITLFARDHVVGAQSSPATGGFIEPATSPASRALVSAAEAAAFLPTRGPFTFPAPYGTRGIRLTNAADCGGRDCVKPVGYSYWNNINNHVGSDTMLIFLGLDRYAGGGGPTLFSVNKATGETRNLGPLFASTSPYSWSSGEGWYFSATRPSTLYVTYGPALLRYDVVARTFQTVFDVTAQFGANRMIWQVHSSNDDRVHSGTLRDRTTYADIGCVAYREDQRQWYFAPRVGDYDECQVDRSGRWLVIKENVDGRNGEDNRIIDLETRTERVLLDENGAGGHSDVGFGYMVAADNYNAVPAAVRVWRFDLDVRGGQPVASVPGQGTLAYQQPFWYGGVGHIAHSNARAGVAPGQQKVCSSHAKRTALPRVNEIVCYRLDGSIDVLVVAPNLSNLDAAGGGSEYNKLPKGNLDPTGEYFIWTANAGTSRLDAFIVRVPSLLDGTTEPPPVSGEEPVRWTSRVNVTASDGALQKTSGCHGCTDAGAISEQKITAGDGALKFTASETTSSRVIGLSTGNAGTQANEIRFGLRLRSGNAVVLEAGIYRKDIPFTSGDAFEVRVERGVVRYAKNGTVFYSSGNAPQYPLLVDTSLSSVGATLTGVRIKQGS